MKSIKIIVCIFIGILLFNKCEILLLPDLSEAETVIITPTDSSTIEESPVLFKWEEVEGAENYNLLFYYHPFDTEYKIIKTDTTVLDTTFSIFPTDNGWHSWQIRAQNESSETDYAVAHFYSDTTQVDSLLLDSIALLLPENNKSFINHTSQVH